MSQCAGRINCRLSLLLQVGIQGVKALEGRHRYQEVAPHVAHHTLHHPLVIALARSPESVLEQVVGLQLGEGTSALAPAVPQTLLAEHHGRFFQIIGKKGFLCPPATSAVLFIYPCALELDCQGPPAGQCIAKGSPDRIR